MNKQLKYNSIFYISILIIILDQLSKLFAFSAKDTNLSVILPNFIRFNYIINRGAAFSILNDFPIFLSFASLLVSLFLISWILYKRIFSINKALAFSLLLGGTLGNGIDRWRLGYVVDFIELIPVQFPIFNIADISINLAVFIIILDNIKFNSLNKRGRHNN